VMEQDWLFINRRCDEADRVITPEPAESSH